MNFDKWNGSNLEEFVWSIEGKMKKDRSRDKIEAMKYNLSLSLSFCLLSTIHVADPPTVSITFEGIIIIDHPPSPSFPRTLFLPVPRRGSSYRLIAIVVGDLAGVKSWTLVYDRSFGIVISLSLSLSLPSFSSRRFRSLLDLGRSKRAMRMIIFARIKIL